MMLKLNGKGGIIWNVFLDHNWNILIYVSRITSHVTKGQWRQMKEGIVGCIHFLSTKRINFRNKMDVLVALY